MITIEDALAHCLEVARPLPAVRCAVPEARGAVLASDAVSALDLPPFPQSAMDGYAVRCADIAAATDDAPATLPLAGEVAASIQGQRAQLRPGQAVRIFTGGLVPDGTDAVVRQEDVAAGDGVASFHAPAADGKNIRRRGEEIAAGTPLLRAGTRLTAGRVAALAAAGLAEIDVRPLPRVHVLVTGNEVVPASADLPLGAVPDANGPLLAGWLAERGVTDVTVRYVHDDESELRAAIADSLAGGDLVVTTGGVSVGEHDLVIPVATSLGVEQVFWRVRQKPGKPLYLGVSEAGVPLLGLPGNPGATLVGAAVYIRRLIDLLQGAAAPGPQWRTAIADSDLRGDAARATWVRVVRRVDDEGRVCVAPSDHQASHMLSNLCEANAFVHLPAGTERVPAGTPVRWLPIAGGED
ncbi:molybdopterin molybdotransferase MoeA [Arhodomonas sp. AD133]|uniref:molybdopterin molybdotransferase MoeA n=1 Tax=Arhodomonas sp. AD133 TaxID=3415009 RepID=UPI003EBB5DAD